MAVIRTKLPLQNISAENCPSCGHRQVKGNKECESCGLVFSKHLGFTPIKTLTSSFLTSKEIKEIRQTQERFSKIKHDTTSKMELLVHCHKEKLLDMAAHHLGKNDTIKNMTLGSLEAEKRYETNSFLAFISKPLVIIPLMLLVLLTVIALILRTYV